MQQHLCCASQTERLQVHHTQKHDCENLSAADGGYLEGGLRRRLLGERKEES